MRSDTACAISLMTAPSMCSTGLQGSPPPSRAVARGEKISVWSRSVVIATGSAIGLTTDTVRNLLGAAGR